MRTFKSSKTRSGSPKVTLYEGGQVVFARTTATARQAANLGRVWADSDNPVRGLTVEHV